jgi:mycothiol synthase
MTIASTHPGPSPSPTGPRVVRVDDALRPLAVARLLGVRAGDSNVRAFIESSAREGDDLRQFWCTLSSAGRPMHALLAMASPGRTAMFFLSPDDPLAQHESGELRRMAGELAIAERGMLVAHAVGVLRGAIREETATGELTLPRYAMAQALLETSQTELIESLLAGGFSRLASLAYMRREIPRRAMFDEPKLPPGVEFVSLASLSEDEAEDALVTALELSYVDTQDCPALCSLRTTDDVIDSHRSVGEYDAALWHVLMVNGAPAGCMLLSRCPAQQMIELVYMGLAPKARGRGLASAMLRLGLNRLAGGPGKWLACAVDEANLPACRLYESLRMKTFTRRIAVVCALRP